MHNFYRLNLTKYSTHQIIIDMIGSFKKVLDVGCNEGYLGMSSDESNRFYGLDYSLNAIEIARTTYTEAFVMDLNSPKKPPFNIDKFNTIIFADVLEHLTDPVATLKFFIPFLRPDGEIIVSLPNVANWQVRLNLLLGKFDYKDNGILDKTHYHLYTFDTAKNLMRSCGLEIIEIRGGASIFGPVILKLPFLMSILSTGIILRCKMTNLK